MARSECALKIHLPRREAVVVISIQVEDVSVSVMFWIRPRDKCKDKCAKYFTSKPTPKLSVIYTKYILIASVCLAKALGFHSQYNSLLDQA